MDQKNIKIKKIKKKKKKKKRIFAFAWVPARPGARGFAHPEPNGVTPLMYSVHISKCSITSTHFCTII